MKHPYTPFKWFLNKGYNGNFPVKVNNNIQNLREHLYSHKRIIILGTLMGEENSKLATRKEMIKTIIMWYTLQLKIGKIKWKHFMIFIKILHCLSYRSLRAYYTISKRGLEKEKKRKL